jgi:hypothetical protein
VKIPNNKSQITNKYQASKSQTTNQYMILMLEIWNFIDFVNGYVNFLVVFVVKSIKFKEIKL